MKPLHTTTAPYPHDDRETWVGFDLDDCLCNMREPLCAAMQRHTGKTMAVSSWSAYDFFSAHMDLDEFLALIVKEGVVDLCLPEPGVARMIDQLQSHGIKSAVVTARGFLPHAQAVTQAWLDRHGLAVDKLVIVPTGQTKVGALDALPNLLGYVDDHVKHLDDVKAAFAISGKPVHLSLVNRPWNQRNRVHHRIEHVAAFGEHMVEIAKQRAPLRSKSRSICPA